MSYGTKRRRVTESLFLGANWAAFSSDLKANGGFDTRKGPGSTANSVGQETDMQRRLLSNGLSGLYIPEAVVWHYVPQARCSRNWALNRSYRQGVSWGLRGSHQDALPQHSRMRRALSLFTSMLWFMVTRFSSSTRVRFSGERRLRWNRGYIHGDNISISRSGMNDMAVHQPSDSKSPGIRIMPDTQYSSNPSSGVQDESSKPDMVVVIATAGRPVLLGRTLDSLASCRLPAGYRETIVVENGPKCGAEDIVRHAKPVLRARYMYEPQGNKSQALNRVLRDLGDAFIFFTDDDTRIESEALACYWEAARQMGTGLFYGGPIGVDYEREPVEWLKTYLPNSARGWKLGQSTRRVRTAKFLGFNWAAFAADLRATDGFDYRKGPGSPTNSVGQETDMQQRLLKAGMCGIYLPGAFVWHYVPESRCTSEWTLERSFRNGVCGGINATRIQGSFIRSRGRDLLKLVHHAGWFLTTRFARRPDIRFRGDYMKRWIEGYRHGRSIVEDTPPANTGSKAA